MLYYTWLERLSRDKYFSLLGPFASYNKEVSWINSSGLYYKTFTIVIYDHNAIDQYFKTTIVDYDRS